MSDEEWAVRHPKRGKAHRYDRDSNQVFGFVGACGRHVRTANPERVPLAQTAPEDRCRTCWPDTKEPK